MASIVNLKMEQGSTFLATLVVTDTDGAAIDLSGYTALTKMKLEQTANVSYTFVTNIVGPDGKINITMDAANTALVPAGKYGYSCKLTNNANVVSRIVEGVVTVTPDVTA